MIRQYLLGLLVALTSLQFSNGADLINTLNATQDLYGTGINNFRVAQSFDTTLTNMIVTQVTLKMFTDGTSGQVKLGIYDATGTGGRPGNLVTNFFTGTVASLPTGNYQNYDFSGLNITLNTTQRYYIVADVGRLNDDAAFVYWQYTTTPPPGSRGDTSVYWQNLDGLNWTAEYVGQPQLMRVVAVPEPGSIALASMCVGALALVRKKRSSRR